LETINIDSFYKPNKMQEVLHASDATFICAWGGAASGKSWFAILEGLFLMRDFPNNEGMVLRYSMRELEDHTIPKYREFAEKMGILFNWKEQKKELWIRSVDPEKPSVIKFRSIKEQGAKTHESMKFGSTEIGFFHIEEGQDPRIKETHWQMLVKRLRRKDNMPIKPFCRGIITCNPPTPDHWIYKKFYHLKDKDDGREGEYQFYHTQTTDNVDETGKPLYDVDNYNRMVADFSPAWQLVYLKGKPAFIPVGRPVWSNFDFANNTGEFDAIPSRRVIRVWDFGRRRSCVEFFQILRIRDEKIYGLQSVRPPLDRIVALRELIFEGKTTSRMAEEVVAYSNTEFPDYNFDDVGDNAGKQKKAEHEKSSFEILKEHHVNIRGRPVQYIRERCIDIIEDKLAQKVQGLPLIQVDERRCPVLTEALSGSWTRNDNGDPDEDNFYEHPSDCLIYLVANYLLSGQRSGVTLKIATPKYGTHASAKREEKIVPFSQRIAR